MFQEEAHAGSSYEVVSVRRVSLELRKTKVQRGETETPAAAHRCPLFSLYQLRVSPFMIQLSADYRTSNRDRLETLYS